MPSSVALFEPGKTVQLPSGMFAEVIAIFTREEEALVATPDGQSFRIRICHLKPLPGR